MKPVVVLAAVLCVVIVAASLVLGSYRPGAAPTANVVNLATEPRHPVTLKMETDAKAVVGDKAPEIDLLDTDGKPWKLSDHVAEGPVVVVTIKDGCPCSIESQPFFNALAAAYTGKVQFVGVMDGDRIKTSKYKDDFSVPFPIVTEPGDRTFAAFQSPRSVYYSLVQKGGVVKRLWPGYSKEMLHEFNRSLAEEAGIDPPKLDVAMAPDKKSSGCAFGQPVGT